MSHTNLHFLPFCCFRSRPITAAGVLLHSTLSSETGHEHQVGKPLVGCCEELNRLPAA